MGMFDHVLIEGHELPGIDSERLERAHRTEREGGQEDLAGKPVVFQTKDLENYLGTYVIKDGGLYERIYEYEDVPEEERPYYGKPEWDEGGPVFGKDFYRRSGSRRVVGHHDEDLEYHGDLIFYAAKKDLGLAEEYGTGLMTFRARFTDGDLQWIRPYDKEEAGPEIREWRTRRRRRGS
jgi:hypothetical protein